MLQKAERFKIRHLVPDRGGRDRQAAVVHDGLGTYRFSRLDVFLNDGTEYSFFPVAKFHIRPLPFGFFCLPGLLALIPSEC